MKLAFAILLAAVVPLLAFAQGPATQPGRLLDCLAPGTKISIGETKGGLWSVTLRERDNYPPAGWEAIEVVTAVGSDWFCYQDMIGLTHRIPQSAILELRTELKLSK